MRMRKIRGRARSRPKHPGCKPPGCECDPDHPRFRERAGADGDRPVRSLDDVVNAFIRDYRDLWRTIARRHFWKCY